MCGAGNKGLAALLVQQLLQLKIRNFNMIIVFSPFFLYNPVSPATPTAI